MSEYVYVLVKEEGEYSGFEYAVLGSFRSVDDLARDVARRKYVEDHVARLEVMRKGYSSIERGDYVVYQTALGEFREVPRLNVPDFTLSQQELQEIDERYAPRHAAAREDALNRICAMTSNRGVAVGEEDIEYVTWWIAEDKRHPVQVIPKKIKELAPKVASTTRDQDIIDWVLDHQHRLYRSR